MTGTIMQFTCTNCGERHVTWDCPTCGHTRRPKSRPSPGLYHVTVTSRRRDAIAELMAEYAAAHPGATPANTNMLDMSLWLASRREAVAAE